MPGRSEGLGTSFWNTLTRSRTAGKIHANFDLQECGQNHDSGNNFRREMRILILNSIILPNLDLDEDSKKARTRFTKNEVDARYDDKVNEGEDF